MQNAVFAKVVLFICLFFSPSLCQSVTLATCVETAEHKGFSLRGSSVYIVYDGPTFTGCLSVRRSRASALRSAHFALL